MIRNLLVLLFGIATGVLIMAAFERLRTSQQARTPESLSDSISDKLETLERSFRSA